MAEKRRPRSVSADDVQSHRDLRSPLPESFDTIKCTNSEQRPGQDLAHAQDDVIKCVHVCMRGVHGKGDVNKNNL